MLTLLRSLLPTATSRASQIAAMVSRALALVPRRDLVSQSEKRMPAWFTGALALLRDMPTVSSHTCSARFVSQSSHFVTRRGKARVHFDAPAGIYEVRRDTRRDVTMEARRSMRLSPLAWASAQCLKRSVLTAQKLCVGFEADAERPAPSSGVGTEEER